MKVSGPKVLPFSFLLSAHSGYREESFMVNTVCPSVSSSNHGSIAQQLIIRILRFSETWIHVLAPPLSGCLTMSNSVTPQILNFLTCEMGIPPISWISVKFRQEDECRALSTVPGS